jgi:hypothetical protein
MMREGGYRGERNHNPVYRANGRRRLHFPVILFSCEFKKGKKKTVHHLISLLFSHNRLKTVKHKSII